MTRLEKLYNIIENSRDLGVRLNKDVLPQAVDLKLISNYYYYHLGLKIEEGKPE